MSEEPYIYSLKAILDTFEIWDSGDCSLARRGEIGKNAKLVSYEDYKKLETQIKTFFERLDAEFEHTKTLTANKLVIVNYQIECSTIREIAENVFTSLRQIWCRRR